MALPVKNFIIQRLIEFDPNFDVGAGVPTTSLMIDPLSIILQPIIDEISVVQASQSILTISESSNPDAFPEDIVDGLASNAFVDRNPGSIGSDVQRIRFFEPQEFGAALGVLIFRGPSGQRFTNSESISITSAEMSLNQDGTLYYIDLPIVALEEGEAFNVSAGGITTMEAEPVGVANTANLFGIKNGRDRETNTELIDRIKVAVTVRALVTGRGIIVTLTENFTTIEEIVPIGFGDDEMMRDIVFNVHIGGNVDVYIKTPSFTPGSLDVFGLEVDTTRQSGANATVAALLDANPYSLGHSPVDRVNNAPVVRSIDKFSTFTEGPDYVIDDASGLFYRIASGAIFHIDDSGADITDSKTITKVGSGVFSSARAGMILTIDLPSSVAGTYTVKKRIDADTVTVFGTFPTTVGGGGVEFQLDDNLSVVFEYNPVTVDIIKESRGPDRDLYTITDVPLMYIESIEKLDPLSGDPTGELLDGTGGYGAGGYGYGPYGIGSGADYKFIVTKPTLRHSELEDNYIEFLASIVGLAIRINYQYASAIPPIQAFMDDRNNQSQSASLLARHFIPAYVDGSAPIIYEIAASSQASAITVDDMTELVIEMINDVDQGDSLELSDIVDLLYDNGARRVDLGTLYKLKGEIHNHDGSVQFVLPDESGLISIPNDEIPDPSNKPLSPRIARFRGRNVLLERVVV